MFNVNELNDKPVGGNIYVTPGIQDNCEIMDVTMETSQTGNPMLMVHIAKADNPNVDSNKDARKFRYNFSTSHFTFGKRTDMTGYELTMTGLLHINNAVCKKTAFLDACVSSGVDGSGVPTVSQVQDFADKLREIWKGETLRMKFVCKEYLKDDNSVGKSTEIGLAPFAEATQEGAENPVVTETKLKYDESSSYDYKRYSGARPSLETNSDSFAESTVGDESF